MVTDSDGKLEANPKISPPCYNCAVLIYMNGLTIANFEWDLYNTRPKVTSKWAETFLCVTDAFDVKAGSKVCPPTAMQTQDSPTVAINNGRRNHLRRSRRAILVDPLFSTRVRMQTLEFARYGLIPLLLALYNLSLFLLSYQWVPEGQSLVSCQLRRPLTIHERGLPRTEFWKPVFCLELWIIESSYIILLLEESSLSLKMTLCLRTYSHKLPKRTSYFISYLVA